MKLNEQTMQNPGKGIGIFGLIGLCCGIILNFIKALNWSHGVMTSEVFGYALGGMLVPLAIAYAIAGRRKVRDWNKVGIWFLAISLGFYLISPR